MSARLRLALSYAAFLEVAGMAIFVVTLSVIKFVPDRPIDATQGFIPNRGDLLDVLLPRAAVMLVGLGVVGLAGGWWLAGRMLRPLQRMHAVAERVAEGSLSHRVHLGGRRDEFRLLADTFDGMLDRVELAFAERSRFAANASHELRTPYAISRSLLDVALSDPAGRDVDQLLARLDETNRRGLDVVESVLALSTLEHGDLARHPVDVAEITQGVVRDLRPFADEAGVALSSAIGEGDIDGDPVMVRQLVTNLVLNGVHHNTGPGGIVELRTETVDGGGVELRVANTGPVVDPAVLGTLTEPFVRGAGRVSRRPDGAVAPRGSGLGLAIVARIAEAHGADLQIVAPPSGGLEVRVRFAPPAAG